MVERAPDGERLKLSLGTLFVSRGAVGAKTCPLLIHFHGAGWIAEVAATEWKSKVAALSIQIGAGSATVGVGSLFLTIAAVVIGGTALSGGKGGILRSALGVLLLTTLNNGLILSGVSPNIQSGVSGAVLIAAIIAAAWPYRGRLRVSK